MPSQTETESQTPVAAKYQFDLNMASRHIAAITGSPDTPIVFQTFAESDEAKRKKLPAKLLYGTVDQNAAALKKLNRQGAGIFICVNEIPITTGTPSPKRTAKNVTAVRSLFVDYDGKAADGSDMPIEERHNWALGAKAIWKDARCVPQLLIESSERKYHAYWRVEDCGLEDFSKLQTALSEKFGTDPSVKDLPRVMRLAGFNAQKGSAEPRVVSILYPKPEARFAKAHQVADIIAGYGLTIDGAAAPTNVDDMFAGDGGFEAMAPARFKLTREDTVGLDKFKSASHHLSEVLLPNGAHWSEPRDNYTTIAFGLDYACDDIDLKVELLAEFSTTYDSEEQAYRPRTSDLVEHERILEGKRAEAQQWFAKQAGTDRDGPQSGLPKIYEAASETGWVYRPPVPKKVAGGAKENIETMDALKTRVVLPHDLTRAELAKFPTVRGGEVGEDGTRKALRVPLTLPNLRHYLKTYGAVIAHNVITNEIDTNIVGCEPSEGHVVMSAVEALLQSNFTTMQFKDNTRLNLYLTTLSTETTVNPVTAYFDSLPAWDNTPRFDQVANLLDVDSYNTLQAMLRIFFISAVAAADHGERSPNKTKISKFETVPIFHGRQGMKKNLFLKHIVPPALREHQADGIKLCFKDKDTRINALNHWIADCSEFETTMAPNILGELKAFISDQRDKIRLPYAKAAAKQPRRTLFTGTVNALSPLLDSTGNRRFPIVSVLSRVDIDQMKALDLDQIWAEAWHRYLDGEQWWMTEQEELVAFAHQQKFDGSGAAFEVQSESLATFYDWGKMPTRLPVGWYKVGSPGHAEWVDMGGRVMGVGAIAREVYSMLSSDEVNAGTASMLGKALARINVDKHGETNNKQTKRAGRVWAMPPKREAQSMNSDIEATPTNDMIVRAQIVDTERRLDKLRAVRADIAAQSPPAATPDLTLDELVADIKTDLAK